MKHVNAGAVSNLPFSSAVEAGEFVFISGQASVDPESGAIVKDSFANEMDRSFENLHRVLAAAGCGLEHLVSVRCYLARQEDLAEFNDIYREIFSPPYPARTTLVGVLGSDFLKFEVDAVARKS